MVSLIFIWTVIIYIFILQYTPLSFFQLYRLTVISIHKNQRLDAVELVRVERQVITLLVTNGANPGSASKIIAQIKSYGLEFNRTFVIKEEYDKFEYGCEEIVVPESYSTRNGSMTKERAMQYAIEYLESQQLVNDRTFLLHLDDDSVVDREYISFILNMPYDAGQGSIRLKNYGQHLFSTLADMIRPVDCDIYCDYFNTKGRPKAVHGEGLVIRSDIEFKIGWDYATYCGEDFLMGQKILASGFKFGRIPYNIYIAPPLNTKDFYKQRRRWMYGMLWSLDLLPNKKMTAFLLYRYIIGWSGFIGVFMFLFGILARLSLNPFFVVLGSINLFSYFLIYQKGVLDTDKKYIPLMLVLQIPVAIYEGGTFLYSAIRKPDRTKFEVIRKP